MKEFTNFGFKMDTELVFGKDAELQTADMIKKYGGTKVLVVTGGGSVKRSGLFDRVAATLNEGGLPYVELSGVQPNPRLSLVYKGIELAKAEEIDFILAIGGGSVIDTSKAIGLALKYDGDIWDLYSGKQKPIPGEMIPVGSIHTISAAGSETSGSTVLLDDVNNHIKKGMMYNYIRCKFAIMNPELTYTVSKYQTGAGTTDVLAHAFDTYFTYLDSYLGDKYCEATMKTAVKYGPIAIKDPENYEARAELMLAGSFSHNDTCRIGRSGSPMAGGGHNLERQISGKFDTAHGAGLAVMMPALLQYDLENDETTVDKIAQFAVRIFDVEPDPKNLKEVAQKGVDRFRAWLKELEMPATIHELIGRELTDDEFEMLVNSPNYLPNGLMSGFGHNTKDDVRNIYASVR